MGAAAAVLFGMKTLLTVGPHGIDVLEAMMTMEPLAGGAGGGM